MKYYQNILFKIAVFVTAVIIIVIFLPSEKRFNYQFDLNRPWQYGQLIATFDFPIYKGEDVIKKEQDSLMTLYKPYYQKNNEIKINQIRNLSLFLNKEKEISNSYKKYLIQTLENIYEKGIISNIDLEQMNEDSIKSILVINNNQAISCSVNDFFTVKEAYEYLINADSTRFDKGILQQYNLNNYINPNMVLDEKKSDASQKELLSNITWAKGMVLSGQKIIDRGELVDAGKFSVLKSYNKESIKRNNSLQQRRVEITGEVLFTSFLLLGFMLYLHLFRIDYFDRKRTILLLFGVIVFFSIITSLMVGHNLFSVYMLPFAMVPMITRVFMDSRTAFMTNCILIVICSIPLHYPYEFIILQFAAGLAAIYSLRELSQRSQLIRSAIIIVITYSLFYFSYELIKVNDLTKIDYSMFNYFIINGIFLLFVYPLLFILEKAFGFTSNVTLVELSNINNPLLREMSEVAPGTFQHSMQVANIAAEAANRIGAKSQLVRTGALYHDIGKMENAVFFTENQAGVNPHENLSYTQSAQVIINHVINGLKLADKYNLPDVIKQFIATHHGKGKTKYFYISYKNEHPNEQVDDKLFTYPGPNPFTKEQAILMMTDTVEAVSRSMKEYTEESISTMVDKAIDAQVQEGFFQDCPITFKDIQICKTVLKEKLRTIYHTRISYPELKGTQTGSTSK
mgnify:CR=1 FL=1